MMQHHIMVNSGVVMNELKGVADILGGGALLPKDASVPVSTFFTVLLICESRALFMLAQYLNISKKNWICRLDVLIQDCCNK